LILFVSLLRLLVLLILIGLLLHFGASYNLLSNDNAKECEWHAQKQDKAEHKDATIEEKEQGMPPEPGQQGSRRGQSRVIALRVQNQQEQGRHQQEQQ
jgi:hypothetical protein